MESRNDLMKTGEISEQAMYAIRETPRSKSVLNNEKMNSKILNVETDQDLRKLLHASLYSSKISDGFYDIVKRVLLSFSYVLYVYTVFQR